MYNIIFCFAGLLNDEVPEFVGALVESLNDAFNAALASGDRDAARLLLVSLAAPQHSPLPMVGRQPASAAAKASPADSSDDVSRSHDQHVSLHGAVAACGGSVVSYLPRSAFLLLLPRLAALGCVRARLGAGGGHGGIAWAGQVRGSYKVAEEWQPILRYGTPCVSSCRNHIYRFHAS